MAGISSKVRPGVNDKDRPRVLIEEWLPIEALGVECRRERGASNALPPIYFLHIWWARRPLTVSRAAVLASLLSANFPQNEFMKLMGILGDPVRARDRIDEANRKGVKLDVGFDYSRAFTNPIPKDSLEKFRKALLATWGWETP